MFVFALVFAAAAAGSFSEMLLQRIVNDTPREKKTVTVGALPRGWTAPVPLPNIQLLGSVATPNFSTDLYYEPVDATSAAQTYAAQLQTLGFHRRMGGPGEASGFIGAAQITSGLTILCRGTQSISINVPARDDMRVSISSPQSLGACGPREPRVTTPLPELVAPPGTTVVADLGGGSGFSAVPSSSWGYSQAVLDTTLPVERLMENFAAQFRAAHWNVQRAFVAKRGGLQSFTYDAGSRHWKATLFVSPGDTAHTYDARIDASGTPMFANSAQTQLAPERPATHLRASSAPAALLLAQRVAETYEAGAGTTSLYPQQLPPAFDRRLPLPSGVLVGSVLAGDKSSALLYDMTKAQFEDYLAQLQHNGWSPLQTGPPRIGGFSFGIPRVSLLCRAGLPTISLSAVENTNHVTMRIGNQPVDSCTLTSGADYAPPRFAPVPPLHAPGNATLTPGETAFIAGQSTASVRSTRPLRDLLSSFASQFTAAGWSAQTPIAADALGSQSFSFTNSDGQRWQAALTMYRSPSSPDRYYAFLNVAP